VKSLSQLCGGDSSIRSIIMDFSLDRGSSKFSEVVPVSVSVLVLVSQKG
jgi:hypothetical protein